MTETFWYAASLLAGKGVATIVDIDDYENLTKYRIHPVGNYVQCHWGHQGRKLLHRMVLNAPDGICVDHINRNPLDNRKSNLRLCTLRQNTINSPQKKNKIGKYKGTSFVKRTGRWQASIKINGHSTHLGYFATEEEAAKAYNETFPPSKILAISSFTRQRMDKHAYK